MRTSAASSFLSSCICTLLCAWSAAAFFNVTQPSKGAQWVNGQTNVLSWDKGLLDNINGWDVELTRMSVDGLILVAKNVPAKPAGLNVYIENVPAGTDYIFLFLNSTHGVLQGSSDLFTILAASGTSSTTQSQVANAATVSVTSGPNPTVFFATTFPALPWSAGVSIWADRRAMLGVLGAAVAGIMGAGWVLLL